MTIVEFLTARLDEKQADAEAARDAHMGYYATVGDAEWRATDSGEGVHTEPHGLNVVVDGHGYLNDSVARHIARHDPVRVLAEVAAQRRIIWQHSESHECPAWDEPHGRVTDYVTEDECRTLRNLAAPDADHPDYNPAWAVA